MSRRKKNDADRRRENQRNFFWPGSAGWIWTMSDEAVVGFATVSRLMPWICTLIRDLSGGRSGDPSSVYWELWCRDWGQGIISIRDEQECAFAAGYTGNRAVRTWKERMFKLVELGFIKTRQVGNHEHAEVLLLNPITVCAKLRSEGRARDEWWTSFVRRAGEIKATIPGPPFFPEASAQQDGPLPTLQPTTEENTLT